MSKFVRRAIVAATLAVVTSAGFSAQEARTLSVTATIPGTCVMTTTPMAFGTLNMAASTAETQTATVTYKCASGLTVTNFTVAGLNTGSFSGTMTGLGPTPDTIPYSITWTPPLAYAGEGFNVTGKQVTLNGRIENADYINKKPDSYSHSVVLAIDF